MEVSWCFALRGSSVAVAARPMHHDSSTLHASARVSGNFKATLALNRSYHTIARTP